MNKPYIVIGDLHGRLSVYETIYNYCKENNYDLICVGDYTDSLEVGTKKQHKLLRRLFSDTDQMVEHPVNVTLLMGNHDLHYLNMKFKCSGYRLNKYLQFHSWYTKLFFNGQLLPYFVIPNTNILITHAGFTHNLIKKYIPNPDVVEFHDVVDFLQVECKNFQSDVLYGYTSIDDYPIYRIGKSSGGNYPYGGIFWCRPTDEEFVYMPNIRQIMGHTSTDNIIEAHGNYWIDCLSNTDKYMLKNKEKFNGFVDYDNYSVLKIENGEIDIVKIPITQ